MTPQMTKRIRLPALHAIVVGDERDDEKGDPEDEPGGRNVVQDHMGVRPGLRCRDVGDGDRQFSSR